MSWGRIHPLSELLVKHLSHQVLAHNANPCTIVAGYQSERLNIGKTSLFPSNMFTSGIKINACCGILEMCGR